MSKMNFTVDISTPTFTVKVDPAAHYGYFEHDELGDECGGGLWFDGKCLTDYDGVFVLPQEVIRGLRDGGFHVGEDFE